MEKFKIAEAASDVFNSILKQVQDSNLNFQLKVSPFSAVISLKKSFIKDKHGNVQLPSSVQEKSVDNSQLQIDLANQDILRLTDEKEKLSDMVKEYEQTSLMAKMSQAASMQQASCF